MAPIFQTLALLVGLLVTSTHANDLTITCRPSPCPSTLPYTSRITLEATYTQTDTNIVPQNITFSYNYRDSTNTDISRPGQPTNWQSQFSQQKTITFEIVPSSLNVTIRSQNNVTATITTVITLSELRLTDQNIVGAKTVAGPSFTLTDLPRVNATSTVVNNTTSSATPSATSSGTGTAPTSSPSKVLVLSGAGSTAWRDWTGWVATAVLAGSFLAL
ncbi:hypothetical protein HDV00_004470 [Rhizophlyctis rosea]|nr:hypothetical protein HDV00_004470 [Rhizophlyctis rosea]